MSGSEIRITASSLTADSASDNRSLAACRRSACSSPDLPALSSACRFIAPATILGMLPEAASLRP